MLEKTLMLILQLFDLDLFLLSVASRSQVRQTCLFQAPAPVPAPVQASVSPQTNPETIHPDLPSSSVLRNSGW